MVDECELGVGFLGRKYDRYDWVGNKCFEYVAEGEYKGNCDDSQLSNIFISQLCGGAQNQYQSAARVSDSV